MYWNKLKENKWASAYKVTPNIFVDLAKAIKVEEDNHMNALWKLSTKATLFECLDDIIREIDVVVPVNATFLIPENVKKENAKNFIAINKEVFTSIEKQIYSGVYLIGKKHMVKPDDMQRSFLDF